MESYWDSEHMGYYYQWIAPLNQWGMKWTPIQGVYSPPIRDTSISWFHLGVPTDLNIIPILGDGVMHFEKIANDTGATYIFYRADLNKIEIWGKDVITVCIKLTEYFNRLPRKNHNKLIPPPLF